MDSVTRTSATEAGCERPARPSVRLARVATPPSVLLVGASTGGPQALTALVTGLAPIVARLPVCVTLHMPAQLVPVIATHVARSCGVETHVVVAQQPLRDGIVYFAPGDRHMHFRQLPETGIEIHLKRGKPGEFCKPAVDMMFASAAACFGQRALAVVLSGMGKDGLAGARALVAAGASVLVQDKATCAVWGMPGAIVKAELAAAELSPAALSAEIKRRVYPFGGAP